MKKTILIFICFVLFAGVSTLKAQQEEIFHVVEVPPKYPGGDDAMLKFIKDNLVYPETAKKYHIQGTVFVQFVIETDGSISNVKILRGIYSECDNEVIRVVNLMPKWSPGMHRGRPVRVFFNLPVRFSLSDK